MKRLLPVICALMFYVPAWGWGQKGHDAIAYIAECNLTPETYAKVVKALGNHSLVYYANWLDNASYTPEYGYTRTWHYANVDKGYTYEKKKKNERGDVVTAINDVVSKLRSGTLSPEQENVNLRILIHLVGDIHAPLHAGHLSDLGGNKIMVKYFNRDYKLHSLWDTALVEAAHKWSYTEWQKQLDIVSPEEKSQMSQGVPEDWLEESRDIAADIYINTPPKSKVAYSYIAHYTPVIEKRILSAGLRLARLLEEIYGGR